MKRILIGLAATTALAGCTTNEAPPPVAVAEAPPPVVEAPPAPKPEIGAFGFDESGMSSIRTPTSLPSTIADMRHPGVSLRPRH